MSDCDLDALLDDAIQMMDEQERQHEEAIRQRDEERTAELMAAESAKGGGGDAGGEGVEDIMKAMASLMGLLNADPETLQNMDDSELQKVIGTIDSAMDSLSTGASAEELAAIKQCKSLIAAASTEEDPEKAQKLMEDLLKGNEKVCSGTATAMAAAQAASEAAKREGSNDEEVNAAAAAAYTAASAAMKAVSDLSESIGGSAPRDTPQPSTESSDEQLIHSLMQVLDNEELLKPYSGMCAAYPRWFEHHKEDKSISDHDRSRFERQYEKTKEVCALLRCGPIVESAERIEAFADLVNELQALGEHPHGLAQLIAMEQGSVDTAGEHHNANVKATEGESASASATATEEK